MSRELLIIAQFSHPQIDRCCEAIPYAKAIVREEINNIRRNHEPYTEKPWFVAPSVGILPLNAQMILLANHTVIRLAFYRNLWLYYADLLVLAGEYEQARPICEQVMEVVEASTIPLSPHVLAFSRIHTSLVYKEIDIEPGSLERRLHCQSLQVYTVELLSWIRYTKWAASFFNKNPRMVERHMLKRRLILPGGNAHPFLDALGGVRWFDEIDKTSMKAKEVLRHFMACQKCRILEIQKTLLICGGCRTVYYW